MSFFESIVLGIVQGLTEFLPVSSSGHLVMAQAVLRESPVPGIFIEVLLHVATLIAVVIVYHRRLLGLAGGAVRGDMEALRYIALLALATLPAGFVGLFLRDAIVRVFDAPAIAGFMLLVTGVLLWSTRRLSFARGTEVPTWSIALIMGCAQAFAILPGISRSGTTIVAGLWSGMRGERAVEFSFLMSIPAIAGAAVLELRHLNDATGHIGLPEAAAGFVAALVSGVAAILALIWLIRRQAFHAFAFYVWPAGLAFLLFLMLRG